MCQIYVVIGLKKQMSFYLLAASYPLVFGSFHMLLEGPTQSNR